MAEALVQEVTKVRPAELEAAHSDRHFVARVAALGAYRRIFDVSAYVAGGELSLGGEGTLHGGHGIFRVARGETAAGLAVAEVSLLGSYELRLQGFRVGVGGGATLLRIRRATGGTLDGPSVDLFARVGYDFGDLAGFYVLGQFEVRTADVWGPTLYAGYRF